MEIEEIDGAPTGLVYVACSAQDGSSYGEDRNLIPINLPKYWTNCLVDLTNGLQGRN